MVTLHQASRDLGVEAAPNHGLRAAGLAGVWRRVLDLVPRIAAEGPCSAVLIETLFRERLAARSGEDRLLGQLECYVRLAEQLLGEGKPEKALEQLRHIFGRSPESMRAGYFSSQVFIVLKRCYRQLGDVEKAERCGAEARRRVVVHAPAAGASATPPVGWPVVFGHRAHLQPLAHSEKVSGGAGGPDSSCHRLRSHRYRRRVVRCYPGTDVPISTSLSLPLPAPEKFRHRRGQTKRPGTRQRRVLAADE